MELEEHYNAREHGDFWRAMPPGALIYYSWSKKAYEICIKPEGMQSTRLLRSVPREEILRWRDPLLTLNYVARRALKDAGLPVEVKIR